LLLISSLLLVLIVSETVLRIYYPQIRNEKKGFEYNKLLGWTQGPNKKLYISLTGDGISRLIETNSYGFRDDEFVVKGNEKRIMVLGDSFVSNYAVDKKDVFTEVMESRMKNTTVMNLGVNAYSNVQEYLLLKQMIYELKPDLIVLMIYIRNDFYENTGVDFGTSLRPGAVLNENTSEVILLPTPDFQSIGTSEKSFWRIYRKSHLYQLLTKRLRQLQYNLERARQTIYRPTKDIPPELYLCRKELTAEVKYLYKLMEQLLLMIAKFADEHNTQIVFVVAPSMVQVEDELWLSILETYKERSEDYDISQPNKGLVKFAKNNSLHMLDLLPYLRLEYAKGIALYNRKEQHWNEAGNLMVANALINYLSAEMK